MVANIIASCQFPFKFLSHLLGVDRSQIADMDGILVEDIFHVQNMNPIDNICNVATVSTLLLKSELLEIDLIVLDVNTFLHPISLSEKWSVCFASTLREDGNPDYGESQFDECGNRADKFDYVMRGQVYSIEGPEASNALPAHFQSVYINVCDVLMCLQGDANHFSLFEEDMYLYILMKKIE